MNILRKLKKAYFRGRKRNVFQIQKRNNTLYLLNYANHIDRKLLVDGRYEVNQLRYIKTLLGSRSIDLFLDIGANIGLYSLFVAQNTNENVEVIAWEPDRRNYAQLHANLLLNRLYDRVAVRNYGASNAAGTVKFLQNRGNSTGQSRIASTQPKTTKQHKFKTISIPVDSIDNDVTVKGKSILIKIDVEGHQSQVLAGMKQLLVNNNCILQVEILRNDDAHLKAFLVKLGYKKNHQIGWDNYFIKTD